MTLHVDRIDLADAVRSGVNPYLVGPYAPGPRRAHPHRPRGRGRDPRRPERRLRAQRAQPAARAERPLPLVRRRRDGPLRPHRRRAGHLPQPVGPHRRLRARARGRRSAVEGDHRVAGREPARRAREGHGQHRPRVPQREAARALVPLRQAVRARPGDPRHARRRGLRRHAALRGLRPRQGRRAHRRADVLRLRDGAAVHALRRRVTRGRRAPLHRHRPARPAPPARHGDHRPPLDPDGPAALQRPRGHAPRPLQALLRPQHAEPLRRHPALRGLVPDPLVRGRAVLHLPLRERLGGGRRGRDGRVPREEPGAAHRPRGPARERALLPAPRRAPAPLPVQHAHRQDDRADDRRRQQRVPVDQQQRAGHAVAVGLHDAHLARVDAAVRRADEVRRAHGRRARRTGSGTAAGDRRRRSHRARERPRRTTATSSPTSTTSARAAPRSRCSTRAT